MFRKVSAALLILAITAFGQAPYPAPQQYPQSQSYPQSQYPTQTQPYSYPQQQSYPPPQGYPQSGYPTYGPQAPQSMPMGDQQHGAARLSIAQGEVNVLRGDNGQLVAAVVNAPLMTQDHLQTSAGSRAEVELDGGNIVRLAPNTDLGFAQVLDGRFQLQLATGTIIYRVLRKTNAQIEIDTPLMGLVAMTEGDYRLSVLPDGSSQVTVRSGQAQILSANRSEYLAAGHSLLVRGNPNNPDFQSESEAAPDQFDDWSGNRDQDLMQSQSYNYVNPNIAGAQDLDQYGNWVPSQYGEVWQPQAPAPDWSPYSTGEWVSEPYYGYTWVDTAPWGWAPFHYGRWFWNGGRGWCWWPGVASAALAWSPAVVGFFSWGGFGLGLLGGMGWVALAPFELFHSWWGNAPSWGWGRPGYGVVRGADVARMYRNAAFRGGALAAPYNGFAGPHSRFTAATRAQLTNASVFQGHIPVSATRGSFLYSNRQAFSSPSLSAAANRQFFRSPQMRSGFMRAPAQSYAGRQGSYASPSQARPMPSGSSGWTRFGDPRGPGSMRQGFVGGSEPSGWHSFGEPSPNQSYRNGYSGSQRSYQSPASRQQYSAPRYSAPQRAPQQHYSAPRSAPAPHYSAPHYSGGGGSHGGGGGGSHSGGGGGHGHR